MPQRVHRSRGRAEAERIGCGGEQALEADVSAGFDQLSHDGVSERRCRLGDEPKGKQWLGRRGTSSEYASPF